MYSKVTSAAVITFWSASSSSLLLLLSLTAFDDFLSFAASLVDNLFFLGAGLYSYNRNRVDVDNLINLYVKYIFLSTIHTVRPDNNMLLFPNHFPIKCSS